LLAGVQKPVIIVAAVYLAVFFALASGVVNAAIEGRGVDALIVQARTIQTMGETVILTVVMFVGFAGILLLHKSGHTTEPKGHTVLLCTGFGALGAAILLGYLIVGLKV
jgi:hypothetical protein